MSEAGLNERFYHLVGDDSGEYATSSCVYIDMLNEPYKVKALIEFAEMLFERAGYKPKVLLLTTRDSLKSYSKSLKFVKAHLEKSEIEFIEQYSSIQIFPETRNTVDRTWRPPVYFGFDLMDRANSLIFYTSQILVDSEIIDIIRDLKGISDFCAAYGFYFPLDLSPIGYFFGISVSSSERKNQGYRREKSERIEHWRDNTMIGILQGQTRHFYSASDGYLRDIYPITVLNDVHLNRKVGNVYFAEFIARHDIGAISQEKGMHILKVPDTKLSKAQRLLDTHNISLSGKRLASLNPS